MLATLCSEMFNAKWHAKWSAVVCWDIRREFARAWRCSTISVGSGLFRFFLLSLSFDYILLRFFHLSTTTTTMHRNLKKAQRNTMQKNEKQAVLVCTMVVSMPKLAQSISHSANNLCTQRWFSLKHIRFGSAAERRTSAMGKARAQPQRNATQPSMLLMCKV